MDNKRIWLENIVERNIAIMLNKTIARIISNNDRPFLLVILVILLD